MFQKNGKGGTMPMEYEIYELIRKQGKKGFLQSKLWKTLGMNSREGSRIALKLEENGLVRREREFSKGRWTYRLYIVENDSSMIHWNDLNGCPCFMCGDLSRCGLQHPISPAFCPLLDGWIVNISNSDGED